MSEIRFSDPSRLHLKKELTQIRKAARVLRDPGTTSSWKSARSAAAASTSASAWKHFENDNAIQNGGTTASHSNNSSTHLGSHFKSVFNNNGSDKKVFLYNWKSQKYSSEKSALPRNDAGDNCESCSVQESLDDSLSDARNVGDSKSDTYLGETRSAAMIFRRRDSNLVSPSMRRAMGVKRKGKKTNTRLDVLSRYQEKEMNLRRLLKGHPSMVLSLGLGRDAIVEQSDDTEEYSNSEDLRKISGASPLLLKLKHKNWSHSPSKFLRTSRQEDSSYCHSTPALSTSSYNKYRNRNPSTVGSWDATTTSMNDGDDEDGDHLDLPGRHGCGIPCYWSKRTPRYRGVCGSSCCSPSLSDTLRRKGSSMLCGSQSMYHRRLRSCSLSNKRRIGSRTRQAFLPLLADSGDGIGGSSIGTGHSDDELSTNYGELDLEALCRLDGRRWSSCRNQDGLEIVALNGDGEDEGTVQNIRSLSQKYKPAFFSELIGQNIVVQSLINAISRGRIARVYLFQGPRGTGKTSAARIFASALNCMSTEEIKPCGCCRECNDSSSGKTKDLWEVDGTDKKGIDKVRYLLKKISRGPPLGPSRYKVFLIDECHLLPSKMWLAFLKFLEEPPQRVVFIFVTTDPDNVPRTVQSRCQKYLFSKIKDRDIVARLRKISNEEKLDVELNALDLIALNADGSLRDAETMLDQLSLLGKKITTSLVNELVGDVSDEKLLELLELAMSSETAETVKRARDLMDSGIDPMVLMSQLASLIMDIIAGTYNVVYAEHGDSLIVTEAELERLKHALRLLSEAEKQLRISSDRSTWFTATLLQLGSTPSMDLTLSSSSRRQSSRTTEENPSSASKESNVYKPNSDAQYFPRRSSSPSSLYRAINGHSSHQGEYEFNVKPPRLMDSNDEMTGNKVFRYKNSDKLDDIWEKCIEKCHSQTLRQLLHAHGKLLSISEVDGALAVYVAFEDEDIKARAERFLSSITNSIEIVLRCNVEVRIVLVSDGLDSLIYANQSELQEGHRQTEATLAIEQGGKANWPGPSGAVVGYSDLESQEESAKLSRGSFNDANAGEKQEMPMQRIESIIHEQRLETAWLQVAEKGTPGSLSRLKPEKNQVLPQEDTYQQNQRESIDSATLSSQKWEDELNHELKVLKMQDQRVLHKDQIGKMVDYYPMSPSLLHGSSYVANGSKESLGYESSSAGGGCSGLFCWNNSRSNRAKAKGTPVGPRGRSGRFSLFGECAKQKKSESRNTL
ncbi:PREDICTED: protein STICHEL-like isoform X2 [Populus euphratica]|uniref:Protein STICHEL-like isoform X2 n=1 Tax=Populus euphratica TaxID=75702 RepID=A0AAJ6TJ48_POPEU|nr:PREDICTED: protein STICHEL-like isoform X2 [Populus euphratica]